MTFYASPVNMCMPLWYLMSKDWYIFIITASIDQCTSKVKFGVYQFFLIISS